MALPTVLLLPCQQHRLLQALGLLVFGMVQLQSQQQVEAEVEAHFPPPPQLAAIMAEAVQLLAAVVVAAVRELAMAQAVEGGLQVPLDCGLTALLV
jgi:hypothetical protein